MKTRDKLLLAGIGLAGAYTGLSYAIFTHVLGKGDYGNKTIEEYIQQFEDARAHTTSAVKKKNYDQVAPVYDAIKREKDWVLQRESQIIQMRSFDNLLLKARVYLCDEPSDKYVIAIHGYHSTGLRDFILFVRFYLEHGVNVILPDDRCHGESAGEYITMGYYESEDCLCWINYVLKHYGRQSKIMLHGISMGAATVLLASGEQLPSQVRCVVEDCSYTSAEEEFKHVIAHSVPHIKLPSFPVLQICNVFCKIKAGFDFQKISPLEAVGRTRLPILFVHGGADDFVPTKMCYALYDACKSEKELLIVKGAAHAGSIAGDPGVYQQKLSGWIKKYM